jgi:hypothetical protein
MGYCAETCDYSSSLECLKPGIVTLQTMYRKDKRAEKWKGIMSSHVHYIVVWS